MSSSKKVSIRSLIIVLAIGLVLLLCIGVVSFIFFNPSHKAANLLKKSDQALNQPTRALPVRLKIPKLSVDAPVSPLGITPAGDMEAPGGPKDVGWYKLGPYPGDTGSAVLDGHFGPWENGEGSVFDNLGTLKKGDSISVVDEKGTNKTFVVRELRTYNKDADTSEVFSSNDGNAHLNIITCTGAWNKNQKSYSSRLVVFTDKQ